MGSSLPVQEITKKLQAAADSFNDYCVSLTDDQYFSQPPGKWSPAQQTKHLITATNTGRLAFVLPKFMVRWVGGKPNRASRTYDELVNKYKLKLEQGGKASSRYIPKPISSSFGKRRMLDDFSSAMNKFAASAGKWKDDQLDRYLAPHPLLGKITLRELCYFTIHHTQHHQETIHKLVNS